MIYTGIGSRATPDNILSKMLAYGYLLGLGGFTLRSGGADGADAAFERGCDKANGKKEIFLPWKGYNKHPSPLHTIPKEAYDVAASLYGSRWDRVNKPIHHLMSRNIQQVMGQTLDTLTDFVVCYTPDGCTHRTQRTKETGGTGQAIACASDLCIPVFNLYNESDEQSLILHLQVFYGMELD